MKKWIWILCIFPYCVYGQIITTYAGGGTTLGDGGPATAALVNAPGGSFFDKEGNLFFSQSISGHRIRRVSALGNITTVAGIGSSGYSGDAGIATLATLNSPNSVTNDTLGNLFIADANNNRIRKVDITTGIITTVVGNGTGGFSGDGGPSTAATVALWGPQDICFDKFGNMYIADLNNNRVRKVNSTGIISTYVGTGVGSSTGDGGPATAATTSPWGICTDDTGNLYIAEAGTGLCKVRKVNSAGIITTIAGTGGYIYGGDGIPATAANINPLFLHFKNGELYIVDKYNQRILKVNKVGIISTVAGNGGTGGFSGDGGPATAATLFDPAGIAMDVCGNLYISDNGNKRIRKVHSGTTIIPTISITSGTSYASGSTVTVTAGVTDTCASYLIHWMNKGIVFATTTTTSVTYTKGAGIDTITARLVPQCGSCYDSTTSLQHMVYNSALGIHGTYMQPVHIYPNPAKSEMTITAGSNITAVSISNIIGQQVYSHVYSSQNGSVNIAHLPPGVYAVRIIGDGWQEVRRVIKE